MTVLACCVSGSFPRCSYSTSSGSGGRVSTNLLLSRVSPTMIAMWASRWEAKVTKPLDVLTPPGSSASSSMRRRSSSISWCVLASCSAQCAGEFRSPPAKASRDWGQSQLLPLSRARSLLRVAAWARRISACSPLVFFTVWAPLTRSPGKARAKKSWSFASERYASGMHSTISVVARGSGRHRSHSKRRCRKSVWARLTKPHTTTTTNHTTRACAQKAGHPWARLPVPRRLSFSTPSPLPRR
mmetsp:Transcript_40576/g.114869  ORF Transcript_40576/g.114869 Transcript_40576/m.114869 type:complete len:242 (+) Transcript_40576:107-832(+)